MTVRQDLSRVIAAIKSAADANFWEASAAVDLRTALDDYFELLAKIRSEGRTEPAWLELKKSALRAERKVGHILVLLDTLAERRLQNMGWLGREMLIFFALAAFVLPIIFRASVGSLILAAFFGVVAWRLLPNFLTMREIRALARDL